MVGLRRGTVALEPYDPTWPAAYRGEVDRLRQLVGKRIRRFEHVGSTAVEGLVAKPIIDLLGIVDTLDSARTLVPVLEANAYEFRPNDPVPDRLFLAKGPRSRRTHYLRLAEPRSDTVREELTFRDHLRTHPEDRAAYAELKRRLAARYPDDREAYTAGKGPFIEGVLVEANRSSQSR